MTLLNDDNSSVTQDKSEIGDQNTNRGQNSYDSMPSSSYYLCVTILIAIQTFGACSLNFIEDIVPWIAIVPTNCIEFIFPSLFFLISCKRHITDPIKDGVSNLKAKKYFAYFLFGFGVSLFVGHFI